jgi:alpha-beta hydrolase superfamily lysophospholipase
LGETRCRIETFTASDGYAWQYRHYEPAAAPRARVVCIHGIQSHGGWYEHSCSYLRKVGFEVFFLDRRGAGLNQQDRGDAPGFRRLLDDLAEFLRPLREPPHAPDSNCSVLRVFLVAISWGGKLAVALQRRHPGRIDGLALLCPGFCPIVGPTLRERIAILWARLMAPRRFFPVPLNDPYLFTASPPWQQFIRDDPLAVRQATARFFVESVRLDGYLRFVPKHVRVPVLLLLAEQDRIIDNARTRRFVERFAAADKRIVEYPGAHHTLEFEPEPQPFLADLSSWLETHCP